MKYIFKKGKNEKTLLLLHGTGGSETDLLSIGKMIDDEANILSIRGQVLENGMSRYFKRLSIGVLDEADLVFRTHELKAFIDLMSQTYQFDTSKMIAFGYSNGANIASSLLFHYKDVLKGAILSHPMVPIRGISVPDLTHTKVFIGASNNDPLTTLEETHELKDIYESAQADVSLYVGSHGHRLSQEELDEAIKWYQNSSL